MSSLFDLFVSFARVTIFGFGGGPSMIPLVRGEVVTLRGWLSPEMFLDAFAFGNSLPGPIVTKLAVYVGHHVAGWPGAAAALLGATVPTIVLMLSIMRIMTVIRKSPALEASLAGIRPIVVALLLLVVWDFAPATFGVDAGVAGPWPYVLIAVVSLYLTVRRNMHPVVLIVVGGVVGMVLTLVA